MTDKCIPRVHIPLHFCRRTIYFPAFNARCAFHKTGVPQRGQCRLSQNAVSQGSLSKKPRRVCGAHAANQSNHFLRGVYIAKNTLREASVECSAKSGSPRRRAQRSLFVNEVRKDFIDMLAPDLGSDVLGTGFGRQLEVFPLQQKEKTHLSMCLFFLELLGRFELPTSSLPRMRSTY